MFVRSCTYVAKVQTINGGKSRRFRHGEELWLRGAPVIFGNYYRDGVATVRRPGEHELRVVPVMRLARSAEASLTLTLVPAVAGPRATAPASHHVRARPAHNPRHPLRNNGVARRLNEHGF